MKKNSEFKPDQKNEEIILFIPTDDTLQNWRHLNQTKSRNEIVFLEGIISQVNANTFIHNLNLAGCGYFLRL